MRFPTQSSPGTPARHPAGLERLTTPAVLLLSLCTSSEFALWDTAGQEEYDRLRPLSYQEANIILICFAVDFPASLHNVEDKWWPEIAHFCEDVPVILVATKTDLRTDQRTKDLLAAQGSHPVTPAEGQKVASCACGDCSRCVLIEFWKA